MSGCGICGCKDFEPNNFQPNKCRNCLHNHDKVLVSNKFEQKQVEEQKKPSPVHSPGVNVGKKGSYRQQTSRQNSGDIFSSKKRIATTTIK